MEKMNFTDNQTAFDYAIYMIVGSYFKKTSCASSLQERSMRLQYCEQKQEIQYRMEDVCISYVEQELLPKLPETFWNREMQVHFVRGCGGGISEIRFSSDTCILRIRGLYKGKHSELFHTVLAKNRRGKNTSSLNQAA